MCEQPVDFVVTVTKRWLPIHAGGFSVADSRICYPQLNGWAMKSLRIRMCMQPAFSIIVTRLTICILICSIVNGGIDRMISAFHLPLSHISRGYNPSLIQFPLGACTSCTLGDRDIRRLDKIFLADFRLGSAFCYSAHLSARAQSKAARFRSV